MSRSHRQQPGLACEDCRRRKARCDRVRPTCGSCKDSDTACRYVDRRPQRGPPKGQVTALKNLIGMSQIVMSLEHLISTVKHQAS